MIHRPSEFKPLDCLVTAGAIEEDLRRLASDLTEAQFHAPGSEGGWSVAYCVEHLVLAGRAFLAKWDLALKEVATHQLYSNGPFPYAWWQRIVLKVLEPPYSVKTKTTRAFMPYTRRSINETTSHFWDMHRELVRRIEVSAPANARRARVQSPFVPWIWYPLGFSFDLALTHERRHLWQAWQVRQQFQNPKR